jgi:hypothetical protein
MLQSMLAGRRAPLSLSGTPSELTTFVLCRHRAIDDRLAAALAAGVAQVVVLGAGYDTRAWRFAPALAGRPGVGGGLPGHGAPQGESRAAQRRALPETNLHRVEVDFERRVVRRSARRAKGSRWARPRSSSGKASRCTSRVGR